MSWLDIMCLFVGMMCLLCLIIIPIENILDARDKKQSWKEKN